MKIITADHSGYSTGCGGEVDLEGVKAIFTELKRDIISSEPGRELSCKFNERPFMEGGIDKNNIGVLDMVERDLFTSVDSVLECSYPDPGYEDIWVHIWNEDGSKFDVNAQFDDGAYAYNVVSHLQRVLHCVDVSEDPEE
jgi:hypothetical protein